MSRKVEGVNASYVGPESNTIRTGDRCRIISDEGTVQHVRWLTGACANQFGEVHRRYLAADLVAQGALDDEFGFESGRHTQNMVINVTAIHTAGGSIAVLEAMESEGHLDNLRYVAQEAVKMMRQAVANDEAWDTVRQSLGATASDVERQAIVAAFIAADESDDVGEDTE